MHMHLHHPTSPPPQGKQQTNKQTKQINPLQFIYNVRLTFETT